MDLLNDEPRKHPCPVPFCQSIIKPSVPEVSLIFPDDSKNNLEKKNDSFSETEFQSYNCWRWKYLKPSEGFKYPESKSNEKCSDIDKCCLIKDKYSSYEVEKRKNEILYGDVDEPRRPLPPRVVPIVNSSSDVLSSFSSFDNFCSFDSDGNEGNKENYTTLNTFNNILKPHNKPMNSSSEYDNSKLYTIIEEQNNQIKVLQKQIEQLLNIQEVKDKQIEQILKTQVTKENKIDQLLECVENRDKEIETLMKTREKQDCHIQELLKVQEKLEKEKMLCLKSLSELQQKKTFKSEGTMTHVVMINSGVNTDSQCFTNEKNDDSNCLRNSSEISGINGRDKSLSLHSNDLPIINEHLPSPQSSIHVDIQDFHDSSEESDSDSLTLSNNCITSEVQFAPIGYTFYNNVMSQVKDIIQNSGEKENKKILDNHSNSNFEKTNKAVKLDHDFNKENESPIQKQITEEDKVFSRNKGAGSINLVQRQIYEPPSLYRNNQSPSDVSFKINALAMKYLKQEQILQYNLEHQFSTPRQSDVTIFNVTNLSVGSMRYLEKHRFIPGAKANIQQKVFLMNECSPVKKIEKNKKLSVEENLTSSLGNVLDISTLNQQAKLF